VAFYDSAHDATPRVEDLSWPELVTLLTTHRRSSCAEFPCGGGCGKNGPAWSPVDIVERRRNENVRAVTVGVFDLDHLTESQLEPIDRLEEQGLSFVVHSTHGHRAPDDICLRLAMPFSRPVLPSEWPMVRAGVVRALALPADPATKDLARLYYLPDTPIRAEPFAVAHDGAALDVDELLRVERLGRASAPSALPATTAPDDGPIDMVDLRARLLRGASELMRSALRGEPLPLGQHDTSIQRLMSSAAWRLPDASDDAILELFRPSFAGTPWREGLEHLMGEARLKLTRGRERHSAEVARRVEANHALVQAVGISRAVSDDAPEDDGDADPNDWIRDLVTKDGRTVRESLDDGEPVKLLNCSSNVTALLTHHPEWRGVIRFNEVTKDLELNGGPLPASTTPDTMPVQVANWIQRSGFVGLGLNPNWGTVAAAIPAVAEQNRYDPLRDYLEGLDWDGTPRCETMLEAYFRAEGPEAYLRAVSLRFMVALVARALRPGCKVDTVLVLEGAQGLRKSTAFRVLGGEWFSDASIHLGDKDSAAMANRFWLIELAELDGMRKASDVEALKAFLSRSEDSYRAPYARTVTKTARRAVFVGTTNSSEYLRRDSSGYRRMWSVRCGSQIDVEGLREVRAQLLAEAVVRFRRGERWWLNDEEAALAEREARERVEDETGPWQESIREWLGRMEPSARPASVRIRDVAGQALGIPDERQVGRVTHQVGATLREMGFTRKLVRVDGVLGARWVLPEELARAPKSAGPAGPKTAGT